MTATAETVRDQEAAIVALRTLATEFPHLPAADFDVTLVISPNAMDQGIKVNLHEGFADFETWREALGIDPATITHREAPTHQCLKAYATFAGVPVELVGFADTIAPRPATLAEVA